MWHKAFPSVLSRGKDDEHKENKFVEGFKNRFLRHRCSVTEMLGW